MSDFQPNTKFYLLSGVKLDHSNKNQILFNTIEQQQAFFKKFITQTVEHGTYQRKTVGVINVPFRFESIASCNYVMWQNSDVSNKWYYAFILQIKYINPNTSQIIYDLDLFQTYMFDVEFKECYVNREHTKRFSDSNKYFPVINREIEDLNYGTDYVTTKEIDIQQIPNVSFLVIGFVGNQLDGTIYGTRINNIPLNITYLIVPIYVSHSETPIRDVTFTFNGTELVGAGKLMRIFRTSTNLVNTMVSCQLYPFLPGALSYTVSGTTYNITSAYYSTGKLLDSEILNVMVAVDNYNFIGLTKQIAQDKYVGVRGYEESKLLMYPYSYGLLTNKRGSDFIVKFEDVDDTSIEMLLQGDISSQPKIGYVIINLNVGNNAKVVPSFPNSHYDETQGIIETIENNFPIIDDYTASYLQSNSNALKVAQSNAKAYLNSAQNQASNTYNTGQQVLNNKDKQALKNFDTNMVTGALNSIGSAVASLEKGNVLSAVVGGLTSSTNAIVNSSNTLSQEQTAIRNSALVEQNTLKNANISATTDYQTTIASINAKVQDAQCIPATAKQLGGDYVFDIIHDCDGIYFQWKTIQPYWADKLTQYFQMYGYKVNKREVPNLKSRKSWNYIKMAECNLFGNIPQDDLMALRDIYLNGITIWHTEDIGNYSLNNDEV